MNCDSAKHDAINSEVPNSESLVYEVNIEVNDSNSGEVNTDDVKSDVINSDVPNSESHIVHEVDIEVNNSHSGEVNTDATDQI
ncbi:MAG: septum site-determining protein MinC, partial [Dolichospermum sp.]